MLTTLTPAYGRDYPSKAAALKDFTDGKDFVIAGMGPDSGRYVTRAELLADGVRSVNVRYKRLTMVAVFPVK